MFDHRRYGNQPRWLQAAEGSRQLGNGQFLTYRGVNAMAESFFATLECELLDRKTFATHAEARAAVFEFVEGWYNTRRRHSALGYVSPLEFERLHATASANIDQPVEASPGAHEPVGARIVTDSRCHQYSSANTRRT